MSPIPIRADPTDLAPIALLVGDPGRAHRIAERLDRDLPPIVVPLAR